MCSFAVGNRLQNVLFVFLALVLGAGAEELLPRLCGVGVPVLLSLALALAPRLGLAQSCIFAAAVGAAEDAVSALPPLTSVSFFLLAAAAARRAGVTRPVSLLAYPCYQLWLSVWTPGLNVFSRCLAAVPTGFLTVLALSLFLSWAAGEREAAS